MTPIRLAGLKEARKAKGLTQMELAQRVGVSQPTISDLEKGITTRIDLDLLDAICRALGISEPGSLFRVDPPARKRK